MIVVLVAEGFRGLVAGFDDLAMITENCRAWGVDLP